MDINYRRVPIKINFYFDMYVFFVLLDNVYV